MAGIVADRAGFAQARVQRGVVEPRRRFSAPLYFCR
jgi:hypothetical protein